MKSSRAKPLGAFAEAMEDVCLLHVVLLSGRTAEIRSGGETLLEEVRLQAQRALENVRGVLISPHGKLLGGCVRKASLSRLLHLLEKWLPNPKLTFDCSRHSVVGVGKQYQAAKHEADSERGWSKERRRADPASSADAGLHVGFFCKMPLRFTSKCLETP